MTKLILTAGLVAVAAAFAPQPVAADTCTDNYEKCLNDTWDKEGVSRFLADIECFAGYVGCVRRMV
jgi:hypothetical protein